MQERDGVSLDAQLDMAREYCQRKGWELVDHYLDVMSGTSDKRPDLSRLERDAKARPKRFDVVICYKLDRISRNVGHFHEILATLEEARVDLVSLTQEIDTTSASGRLLLNILISVAQNESETISERVSMAMRFKAGQGACLITSPPYGYRYVSKETDDEGRIVQARLEVNGEEAHVVKTIFRLYLELRSVYAVAKRLNSAGVAARHGGEWNSGVVARILQNPLYKGDLIFGREVNQKRGRKRHRIVQPRENWIVHEGKVPAIVDGPMMEAAAEILKTNASMAPRRSHAFQNRAWSAVLFCAGCGHPMWYHSSSAGMEGRYWGAYGCHTGHGKGALGSCGVRARLTDLMLESLVLPAIAEAFDRAAMVEHSGATAPGHAPARKRQSRAKQVADIEEERRRLNRAYFTTKRIGDEEYDAAMAALEQKQAALFREEEPAALPLLPVLPASFMEMWERMPTDGDRGRLVRSVVDHIDVDRELATIRLRPFDHPAWPDEPILVQKKRIRRMGKRSV